jgi:hypothetical protein
MSLMGSVKLILTLRCREASRLIAERADRDLPWDERWALRLHLISCGACRNFTQQLKFLTRLLRGLEERLAAGEVLTDEQLPEATRQRLEQLIQSRQGDLPE